MPGRHYQCAYCYKSITRKSDSRQVDQRLVPTLELAGQQLLPGCERWHTRCAMQAKRLVAARGVVIPWRKRAPRASEVDSLGDVVLAHSRWQGSHGEKDA